MQTGAPRASARRQRRYLVMAALAALTLIPSAHAAAPKPRTTVVSHGDTFSAFFPDDICGPRASTVTWSVRTQALHWDERPDGTFNVQWTQTGTYHVDFVDPALADQVSQYTDQIHHVLTPAQTEVYNETFHDFPTGLKIWVRIHATIVDGQMIVEREIDKVTGCP